MHFCLHYNQYGLVRGSIRPMFRNNSFKGKSHEVCLTDKIEGRILLRVADDNGNINPRKEIHTEC